MARNNRHNAAFVVGSVLGAVAGAAAALWKTPYTGEELRAKLTGSGSRDTTEVRTLSATPSTVSAPTTTTTTTTGDQRTIRDKVLSGVEKTLAPIVGVELGKTANGSGPLRSTKTASGSNMKVNRDLTTGQGTTTSAAQRSGDASVSHAADGTETLGLSRDRVDAEKWAAAYAGTDTGSDTSDTGPIPSDSRATPPAAPAPAPVSQKEQKDTTSGQPTLLRHPHAWHGETAGTSVTHAADGSSMIGLSRDKVDAEKWAAAYAGETVEPTPDTTTTRTPSTSAHDTTDTTSKAAESAAQTGLGADPAFPGSDHIGHPPADTSAPDSSVADVSRGPGPGRSEELHSVSDAATVEQLTSPQVDRVPDSARTPTDHAAHPFPKLGGHED